MAYSLRGGLVAFVSVVVGRVNLVFSLFVLSMRVNQRINCHSIFVGKRLGAVYSVWLIQGFRFLVSVFCRPFYTVAGRIIVFVLCFLHLGRTICLPKRYSVVEGHDVCSVEGASGHGCG